MSAIWRPAVLSRVAVIGDDGGDPAGRGAPQRIGQDQQFHQVVVGRERGRLQDEDVLAPDVLLDDGEDLVIGESLHVGLGQGHVEVMRDRL